MYDVTDKRNDISMAAQQAPGLGMTDNVYSSLLANRISSSDLGVDDVRHSQTRSLRGRH